MEKNFGTRVRQARHKAGLTQAALAEKLNLDETTISRIENGSQATSFATMLNFSEALDVKFDYLICDYLDDSIHSKDPINAEILDMITPLPDNYKRLIRDNIRQRGGVTLCVVRVRSDLYGRHAARERRVQRL